MNILAKKLTRRDFIKKGVIALGSVSLATYLLKRSFQKDMGNLSKEAYHYTRALGRTECQLCPNNCILDPGDTGTCRVRANHDGTLYTKAYGNPCSLNIDPIEKKPLYHFLPTSKALSVAVAGCNLRCLNCQNWEISQTSPDKTRNYDLPHNDLVSLAREKSCQNIAYTYSEPVTFYEYMYDAAQLAHAAGIKNVMVTNGYINETPLKELCTFLDAANVDLKSFDDNIYEQLNGGKRAPVLDTLKTMKKQDVWFEVTRLIVPSWSDDLDDIKAMTDWMYTNLGPDYPLHISRFSPMYKLTHLPPTPIKTLEKARDIAKDSGLNYVYIGNVPASSASHTYCPSCNKAVVKRNGYLITEFHIDDNSCSFCGQKIAGVWHA